MRFLQIAGEGQQRDRREVLESVGLDDQRRAGLSEIAG
jgi:hypothetical protein